MADLTIDFSNGVAYVDGRPTDNPKAEGIAFPITFADAANQNLVSEQEQAAVDQKLDSQGYRFGGYSTETGNKPVTRVIAYVK